MVTALCENVGSKPLLVLASSIRVGGSVWSLRSWHQSREEARREKRRRVG